MNFIINKKNKFIVAKFCGGLSMSNKLKALFVFLADLFPSAGSTQQKLCSKWNFNL